MCVCVCVFVPVPAVGRRRSSGLHHSQMCSSVCSASVPHSLSLIPSQAPLPQALQILSAVRALELETLQWSQLRATAPWCELDLLNRRASSSWEGASRRESEWKNPLRSILTRPARRRGLFWASFPLWEGVCLKEPRLVPWMKATEFSQIQEQTHGNLDHTLGYRQLCFLCFLFRRPREGLGAAEMPYWLETGNPDQSPRVVLRPIVKAPTCAVTQSWDPAGSQAGLPPSRGS